MSDTPKYPVVGHCIYHAAKGDHTGKLTEEHIIPLGLGGELILRDASCPRCRVETCKIEDLVLRKMLKNIRTHLQMKSRRKLPTTLPMLRGESTEQVPVADHPGLLALQRFRGADALIHNAGGTDIQEVMLDTFWWKGVSHRMTLEGIGLQILVAPLMMQRALAKIAHGYACAEMNEGDFAHWLPDFIINGGTYNWLVGSTAERKPSKDTDAMPDVSHRLVLRKKLSSRGRAFLICEIELFQDFGMPTYEVVVGPLQKEVSSSDPISSFTQHM